MTIYELDTVLDTKGSERIVVTTTTTLEVQMLQPDGTWETADTITRYGALNSEDVRDCAIADFGWSFNA
jgi:hypothetical protein